MAPAVGRKGKFCSASVGVGKSSLSEEKVICASNESVAEQVNVVVRVTVRCVPTVVSSESAEKAV